MGAADFIALSPLGALAASCLVLMLSISLRRDHRTSATITGIGLAVALCTLPAVLRVPRAVTGLLILDPYSVFYLALLFSAGLCVTGLSYGYLRDRTLNRDEFYLLLLLATLGAGVIAASSHFVSFFLGLETLSISLYALIAYPRSRDEQIEAALKYLILAGVSSSFLVLGMGIVYAGTGTMEFGRLASILGALPTGMDRALARGGLGLIVVGIGFKLAVAPFHSWTPDVYQGAPAPVTAFVATVSKGAMVALLVRFFLGTDGRLPGALQEVFFVLAVASMIAGNLLALLQRNVKRMLAYSSIAHLGYVLVALLAGGPLGVTAVTFYMVAYFVTTLGAFGVMTVLSPELRDADRLEDYRGLAWRSPGLALIFTAMVLSLAGIPLTAGFLGKFILVKAGVDSRLWTPVIVLVLTSGMGLYYYLRILVAVFSQPSASNDFPSVLSSIPVSLPDRVVLGFLTLALVWIGIRPGGLIDLIRTLTQGRV
jgi:NADH-quinone oxidoreductase subunit N